MSDSARAGAFDVWQREHSAALAELQEAQRSYHRTVATTAFQGSSEGQRGEELRRASLQALDAARIKLDEVRARKPETP